jgi:DNA polymerase elongation subunit (family B)
LIPWKPVLAESFKSRAELLVADRGGFIFEPELGVHEQVGELDFSSLFPSIMSKKNISPETVRCTCCPDSANRVPELDWNVCERRRGIVPKAVEIIVEKRMKYKRLEKVSEGEERARYESRRNALKWVGVACLLKESPVFIRSDCADRFVRIGDFIDGLVGDRVGVIECPPGVFVAGVGHDHKAKYCKVARLIKKPNDQKLLSFVMEDGRKIVTTPDHPFFTLRKGKLEVKAAEELEIGEVVPTARKISSSNNRIERIDLIERLGELLSPEEQRFWRVSGDQFKKEIKAKRRSLIKAAVSEGYAYQSVAAWIGSGIIPLRFFGLLDIAPEARMTAKIGVGRRNGGRVAWLPAVLQVDEKLGFFLGLFVADGSATGRCVRLDIGLCEPDLLEIIKRMVESIFRVSPHVYKEKKAEMYVVQINSASLVRILEKVFDLPGSAERGKLRVPDVIFNCQDKVAHRFTAGLVAGDGHMGKPRKFVAIATSSKDLQDQIGFLAAKLGLTFRLGTNREGTQSLYTVNFVGPETLRSIAEWEYSKEKQRATILTWAEESLSGTCDHPRYERLPVEESGLYALARSSRTSSDPHAREGFRMCPRQVRKKISRMQSRRLDEDQIAQMNRVEKLIDGDLGFVRIRKIERLEACPEYVYCFQLEDDEVPGFFAGEDLTFTHNYFGYLGFNNAKFGRIDAHIGVCAWDRKVLVDAARVAERRGFRVMHGIVDSLWLKKEGAGEEDFQRLRREIEAETKFAISFEGIYKWIAFLPSKVNAGVPVLNQYFGAYWDGRIKVRGIEARRHDTPAFFSKCQLEILELLARAETVEEAAAMVGECIGVFLAHARSLLEHRAPIEGLVFTRNLSKKPGEYANRSLTSSVADQLVREGVELHAGEAVQYVITDYESKSAGRRAVAFELVDAKTVYDAKRYVALLAETCSTVLKPFREDCSAERLVQIANGEILHAEALI